MIRARFNVVYDVSKLYTTVSRQYIIPGVGIVNRLEGSTQHFEDVDGMLFKMNNIVNDSIKLQRFTDDACTQIVLLAKKVYWPTEFFVTIVSMAKRDLSETRKRSKARAATQSGAREHTASVARTRASRADRSSSEA